MICIIVDNAFNHWSRITNPGVIGEPIQVPQVALDAPLLVLGSEDELPENTASQIEQIVGRMEREHANLTYTDWIEKTTNSSVVRRPGPYNWAKHITSPVWMHQLVVMRTSAAQELARRLPHGLHWTEFLLYAPLAQKNPIYWPEVSYFWHKGETGMHCHEHIAKAQQNSVLWYLQKGRT